MLEIKEFRCEVKIEESEKAGSQCSAAKPRYPDNHHPAQVVLNASVAHLAVAGVLGLTPGDCWPFHFPLFSPYMYITSKCPLFVVLYIWHYVYTCMNGCAHP